jgi:hypothetical protein
MEWKNNLKENEMNSKNNRKVINQKWLLQTCLEKPLYFG